MIFIIGRVCKACKSFVTRCGPEKNHLSKKLKKRERDKAVDEVCQCPEDRNTNNDTVHAVPNSRDNDSASLRDHIKHSFENCVVGSPDSTAPGSSSTSPTPQSRNSHPPIMRSSSRLSQSSTLTSRASLSRSKSQTNSREQSGFSAPLSRSTSRKGPNPIMYSNSNGLVKPPATEQQLECTLEELCFGCIKHVNVTRNSVRINGQIVPEDELLTIKVKSGWKSGTTITFDGREIPAMYTADIIFIVAEKPHPLFRREGDDLEVVVEIPLVQALTGCTLSVPSLGGQEMNVTIDDIIYPGYKHIIQGEGMPKQKDKGKRGNLIVTILVGFPQEMTDEQRVDVVHILQDTF